MTDNLFENAKSRTSDADNHQAKLDLIGLVAEGNKSEPEETITTKAIPAARWTLLAGTTAGLTELTVSQLSRSTAQTPAGASGELLTDLQRTASLNYPAMDKLRNHSASVTGEIGLALHAPNGAKAAVNDILTTADKVAGLERSKLSLGLARNTTEQQLQQHIKGLTAEQKQLSARFLANADAWDIMHNDNILLNHTQSKAGIPLAADELRTFATSTFNEGSLYRKGLLDRAAAMQVGEKVAPSAVYKEIIPAWQQQLVLNQLDSRRLSTLNAQLAELERGLSSPGNVKSILNASDNGLGGPVFSSTDAGRRAMMEFGHANQLYAHNSAQLAHETFTLTNKARNLQSQMSAELLSVRTAAGHSFARGFGKGVVAMSVGIGAGYTIDQLTGEERTSFNSPIGLGLDAAAGLALFSNLPGKYKYPLAIAAIAAPRVLHAYGYGDNLLAPTTLSSDSLWKPNAVDAIGVGVAVSLPIPGNYKAAAVGGAIVGGRVYNAMNYKKSEWTILR